jgi:hypothetical protein
MATVRHAWQNVVAGDKTLSPATCSATNVVAEQVALTRLKQVAA